MRICFICTEYPPARHGGIGAVTEVLGRALVARGHEVRVVGCYYHGDGLRCEDHDGVRVWRLPFGDRRWDWILARYELFKTVAAWANDKEIDLIEVPDFEGWVAGWTSLPVPVVARLHGSGTYFNAEMGLPVPPLHFRLERASLRRADFHCSTSRYTARATESLFGLDLGGAAVLYNPVELPAMPRRERSPNEVVFAGTMTRKKGFHSLLRAWPLVLASCPAAELHVFGRDPGEAGELRAAAARVRYHGQVPRERVLEAFGRARVAVFPSYAEAFAMAPLEAMAHACPTVYTCRSSGPECIEDGVDGILIDPDRPEQIAAAIIRVLLDDAFSRRLGEAGRARIARSFSTSVLVARNENFYLECVHCHRRAEARHASPRLAS